MSTINDDDDDDNDNDAWFQASAAMSMRSSFVCDITKCRLVIIYGRLG